MANRKNNTRVVLETQQIPWMKLRGQVVTDDATVLGVTTRDFANRNVGTGDAVEIPYGVNSAIITFLGKLKDQTAAFSWRLYGYRAANGMAEFLANGTGNLGDVAATVHPITKDAATDLFYADFLTIIAQQHIKTISVKDVGASSGEVAKIVLDLAGLTWILLELTDCNAGTANEADQLEAIYTGF